MCENLRLFQNLILNPKLIQNKNEIKESFLNIFRNIYSQLKNMKDFSCLLKDSKFSYFQGVLNFYFYFHREKSIDNSSKVIGKIYCIFPNINLELKRINKIPISRSVLSKFLVSGGRFDKLEKSEAEELKNSWYRDGFLAMSSKHRLITLQNTGESMKEILFGIWLNLTEEKVNKNYSNEEFFLRIINKYSLEIYEKSLGFLIKSKKIEVINSPSPDEGVFLMCLFLNGAQLFYEIKIFPNEKEKVFINTENKASSLVSFSNEWLIMKKKFVLENKSNIRINALKNNIVKNNNNFPSQIFSNNLVKIDFDCSSNIKIMTIREYLNKKFMPNVKEYGRGSKNTNDRISNTIITNNSLNKNNNPNKYGNSNLVLNKDKNKFSTSNSNSNFKDPLDEIFEDDKKHYQKYDFPLSVPSKQNYKNNSNFNLIEKNQNIVNSNKGIPPKATNKGSLIKNNSTTLRTVLDEKEALLRENLMTKKHSNPNLIHNSKMNLIGGNSLDKRNLHDYNSNHVEDKEKDNQTLTITNTSKGFSEQQSFQNIQNVQNLKNVQNFSNKLQGIYSKDINSNYFRTIEDENNMYINHKKQLSNNIGFYTAQNFFPNQMNSFEKNPQIEIDVGKSTQIEKSVFNVLNLNTNSNLANPNKNLNSKPSIELAPPETNSNMQNAYEIIYDQAKSIQLLQEQIIKLQTELNFVVNKMKIQEDSQRNSMICSCGGKKSSEKQNVISTGTNTSIDIQNFNAGFNNFHFDNNNPSNSNSMKSNNNNYPNTSSKPFNEMENNTTTILANQNVQTLTAYKSEDDLRYENFLNENSINFPKQFLDIDLKHFDLANKEEMTSQVTKNHNKIDNKNNRILTSLNNSNNLRNSYQNNFNTLEKDIRDTSLPNKNINNSNTYIIDEISNYRNINYDTVKEKEHSKTLFSVGVNYDYNTNKNMDFNRNNFKYIVPNSTHISKNLIQTETSKDATNNISSLKFNLNNIDITNTSIDPPSYRYFLKVPSLNLKSNNSLAYDDNIPENAIRRKSLDTTRVNDYTINLPKIIFNESIESLEENDGE